MAILLNKTPRPERVALVLEQPRMAEELVGGAGIGDTAKSLAGLS